MMFFIIVFLIFTAVNAYLFYKGWQALPLSKTAKVIYSVAVGVLYSAFLIAMLGRNILPLGLQKVLYCIGTWWMGAMLYLTIWFAVTDLIRCIPGIKKHISSTVFHRRRAMMGYTLVVIVLISGYYRFTHPVVVEREITIEKSGGKYTDLKVLAFSDIHLGVAIDKKKLQKYVRFINAQHPDIILFAGDMVDNNALPLEKEKMYEEINQLQAPLGVYFCPGNHEYLSGIEASRAFLEKTNMTLLFDKVVQIDGSFWIISRDDKQGNPNRRALSELVAETNPEQPLFLLDHEPYSLEKAVENGVDLQVSGHTHHGQLWPFNKLVDSMYEVGHGYKQKGRTHIYITSGLGLWGPPMRIGTQSEIVVFNIHFRD